MSSVRYYLRNQKHASCFLQAPCVFTSYLLQTHGLDIPPIDGSRLIRHEFTSDQLHTYAVINRGGDSKSIFQIIEKQFFDCTRKQRPLNSFESHSLVKKEYSAVVKNFLRVGPGLISKFEIPYNFSLEREAGQKLGFGIARFTEWNQVGKWFPLGGDATEEEKLRAGRWKVLCLAEHPAMDVGSLDDLTLATTGSTRSSAGESQDSNEESSEDTSEDSSEESSEESDEEPVEDWFEGPSDAEAVQAQLHALILLGVKEENGEDFWVLQNTWLNNMRIIEMSTEYLSKSGATITFADKKIYEPRKQTRKQIVCCSSPVAESALFERADCENWDDVLVYPEASWGKKEGVIE